MSPKPTGLLAYWHSGGAIESRSGSVTDDRAFQLLQFHAAELCAACDRQDAAAAVHCARVCRDIAVAIVAADRWRGAAAPGRLRASGEFAATSLRNC